MLTDKRIKERKENNNMLERELINKSLFVSTLILAKSYGVIQQLDEEYDNQNIQNSNFMSKGFQDSIEEQIKNVKYGQALEQQLLEQLAQIYEWSLELEKNQIKNKITEMKNFYDTLETMFKEWKLQISQCSRIIKFIMKNKNVEKKEGEIKELIQNFHSDFYRFMESSSQITMSNFLKKTSIIDAETLDYSVTFLLTLGSRENQLNNPIELTLNIQSKPNKFVKLIKEDLLLQTLQEKLQKFKSEDSYNVNLETETISKQDKDYWVSKIQKKLKKQIKSVFLDIEFHKQQKMIIIHSQMQKPFIITNRNSPICLAPKQILKFENNLQIEVMKIVDYCNQQKVDLQDQKNHLNQDPYQERIVNDKNLNFIKLKLEKFQQNNFLKEYEFYLKQNQIDLRNQLPGIKGILKNDQNGFTLEPHEGQYYKLHTDAVLVTKSRNIKFSLEVDLDFWITVEIDLDKNENCIY